MSKVTVKGFSVSLDGFGAGPDQDKDNPLGKGGTKIHEWVFKTKAFQKMLGKEGGEEGIDNDFMIKLLEKSGACIMGRNMFGPVRGPWPDDAWKGWWGEEPPYHAPVFVLTHHPRKPIVMKGGTTFYFVDGVESALREAKKVADGKDINIAGGVSTIRQFLQAGYIDEMHLAFSPVFLGKGEHLFSGIDMSKFTQIQRVEGEGATHIILK